MKNKNMKNSVKKSREQLIKEGIAKEHFTRLCMVGLMNQLAENSLNGIVPFSKVTLEDLDKELVIYDDFLDYGTGEKRYPIAATCSKDENGKVKIDQYMNDMFVFGGIRFDAILAEDGTVSHIQTELFERDKDIDLCIVVEDGKWFVATLDSEETESPENSEQSSEA